MRILFLAEINSVHFRRWAEALCDRGIQAGVYSLSAPNDNWHERLGVELLSGIAKTTVSKWSYFLKSAEVKNALNKFKPDLAHAHYASSYGMLAREGGFHPCIISVWGSDILKFPRQLFINKRILKKNLAFADFILATGEALKKETQRYTEKNIELTPFGVDTNVFVPSPIQNNNEFVIACAKNMETIYGIEKLINLVAELHKPFPQVRLKLAGDGSQLNAYKKLSAELGIEHIVEFKGNMPHHAIPAFYSTANLGMFLSESESFGVSVLEASACEIPVVCSQAGGFTDVVNNGVTGFIVDRQNTNLLFETVKRIIENEELRITMGKAGRLFVKEKYEWSKCVDTMMAVYSKAIFNERT